MTVAAAALAALSILPLCLVGASNWELPAEPARVAGPVYFVGTRGLAVWLIKTSEGHILLNTGTRASGPMIEASIRKLGLNPQDIKILLTCHAHMDHVGGHAYMKKISGAQVATMDREKELIESGGRADFLFANALDRFGFDPVKVDRVFRDGETIRLGDVALTARLTPGHTKGSTTYVTQVVEGGRSYQVVFPDGTGINPGTRFAKQPSYPGIGDDCRQTYRVLESLKPDIWLTPHNEPSGLEDKKARAAREGVNAWVDPEGYKKWVATQRRRFEDAVRSELATPAGTK